MYAFLSNKEYASAYDEFCRYFNQLEDHIAIENVELFPLADDILSEEEQERIYFQAIDFNTENVLLTDFEKYYTFLLNESERQN